MSHEENERNPERVAVPFVPTAADEVTEVRVMRSLAAIGTVFGALAVVSLPLGMIHFHQGAIPGDMEVSLLSQPVQSPSLQAIWLFFSALSGAGLGMMLLVGSVGALTIRRWARPVLLLWAISSLILSACGSLFYFRWLLPPWREQSAQVRGVIDLLVTFGGWGIGSVLAIAVLVFLTRPNVRAVFEKADW